MSQRFSIKKTLTKLVGMPDWIIYRDSVNGMYALNTGSRNDINLMYWNITLTNPRLDFIIKDIQSQIKDAEKEEAELLARVTEQNNRNNNV